MSALVRTFAARVDGDGYGRHALREPGGDNRQRDVAHIVRLLKYGIHPTRYDADYRPRHAAPTIGRHSEPIFGAFGVQS